MPQEPAGECGDEVGLAEEADGSVGQRIGPRASAARDRIELGGIGLDVDISLVAELRILEA
jgi:hypothetical protein